jgi:hypothetical protein
MIGNASCMIRHPDKSGPAYGPSPGLDTTRSAMRTQIKPSKTKHGQTQPSKIAWFDLVLFVRIGAFQWVMANPNKIFPRHLAKHALVVSPPERACRPLISSGRTTPGDRVPHREGS